MADIRISVDLYASAGDYGTADDVSSRWLKFYIRNYADDLFKDLGLAAECALQLSKSANPGEQFFRVRVGEAPCRGPMRSTGPITNPRDLAERISAVLFTNRELLVQAYVSGDNQALARMLSRYCFRIDRTNASRVTDAPVEVLFEHAVAESEGIGLRLFLGAALAAGKADGEERFRDLMKTAAEGLFWELGITVPEFVIQSSSELDDISFQLQINDLRLPPMSGLKPGQIMINESPERLRLFKVSALAAVNPVTGANAAIVQDTGDTAKTCRDLGFTVLDAREYVQFAVSSAVRRYAECLLTLDLAETMLARVNDFFPQTVRTFRQRDSRSAIDLIRVLRELLEEEVSIRDLPLILDSLCAVQSVTHADANELIIFLSDPTDVHVAAPEKRSISELDVRDYTACVRMALKRYLTHKYTRGNNTLVVYLLDRNIEKMLMEPLSADHAATLRKEVANEIGSLWPGAQKAVILTSTSVRKHVWQVLEKEFPELAVVSYQELVPDINIQPIARISWPETVEPEECASSK